MKDDILNWFVNGERGLSSEAMAAAVLGIEKTSRFPQLPHHPYDASDFGRCVMFLDMVPDARMHMDKVAALSDVWKKLVDEWDVIEMEYRAEKMGYGFSPTASKMISKIVYQ